MTHTTKARLGRGLLIVLALAALTLAALPQAFAAPRAQEVTTLRIGYLGAPDSDTANGAQLAIDQINALGGFAAPDGTLYQFDLMTLAEAPTQDSLASAIAALLAQNPVALLGPDENDLLNDMTFNMLVKAGLPVFTGATSDFLTDNDTHDVLFRIRAPERVYSYALATYLLDDRQVTEIALVQTQVEATEAYLDFLSVMQARGLQPVAQVQMADAAEGLLPKAQQLAETAPAAVVMWGTPEDAVSMLSVLRKNGWQGLFAYPDAEEAARAGVLPDALAGGTVGVTAWSYAYPDSVSMTFLEDYVLAFSRVPGPMAAAAYDAMWYLRAVIRSQGVEAEAIRAGLIAGAPLPLVSGELNGSAWGNGDLVRRAMVYVLAPTGGPQVVAVFDDTQRLPFTPAE